MYVSPAVRCRWNSSSGRCERFSPSRLWQTPPVTPPAAGPPISLGRSDLSPADPPTAPGRRSYCRSVHEDGDTGWLKLNQHWRDIDDDNLFHSTCLNQHACVCMSSSLGKSHLNGLHFGCPLFGFVQGVSEGQNIGQVCWDILGLHYDAFQCQQTVARPAEEQRDNSHEPPTTCVVLWMKANSKEKASGVTSPKRANNPSLLYSHLSGFLQA